MNEQPQDQASQAAPFFDSAAIANKKKPKFFVRIQESKKFTKKQKILLAIGAAVLFIALVALIAWAVLAFTKKATPEQPQPVDKITELRESIEDVASKDSPLAYSDAKQALNLKLEKSRDLVERLKISLILVDLFNQNDDYAQSIETLLSFDPEDFDFAEQEKLYAALVFTYSQMGDETSRDIYIEKMQAMYAAQSSKQNQ